MGDLVGGIPGIPTPLKNMKVSWDDEIPKIWKVIKAMFQTTNQSESWRNGLNLFWGNLEMQKETRNLVKIWHHFEVSERNCDRGPQKTPTTCSACRIGKLQD